ncbi:MAG: response regulator, partial [bacterium]
GDIEISTQVGKGTCFRVYLPRVDSPTVVSSSDTTPVGPHRGWETILLVEDEEAVRSFACETLQMNGYTVLAAGNGQEALQISQRHNGPIHLVITDVVMPGMSGRTLAEHLAPVHPDMRVLYMSGYTDDEIIQHGVLDDKIPFMQKPFSLDTLTLRVREILDASGSGY